MIRTPTHDKSLCRQMFGKKRCELTAEENREYNRIIKARYRETHPETVNEERDYAIQYYYNNKDRALAYNKQYQREHLRKSNPFGEKLSRKVFGIAVSKMDPETKRKYNTMRNKMWRNKQKQVGDLANGKDTNNS